MQPGVYPDIPNESYHRGPGISKSGLDLVRVSPLHLRHVQVAANDHEPTTAQMVGTAFHCLLLEPHEFVKTYTRALRHVDVPDAIADRDTLVAMVQELNKGRLPKLSSSGTKDELVARIVAAEKEQGAEPTPEDALQGLKLADLKAHLGMLNDKRAGLLSTTGSMAELAQLLRDAGRPVTLWADVKAEWMENNGHRNVLEDDLWEQLHRMRDAVMAHPMAAKLLSQGVAEQSVYWTDEATGELCRCRPDWWRPDDIVVDLKTCEDASAEGFAHSIRKWRYYVQQAFYMDGLEAATGKRPRAFVFLAVEKSACLVEGQPKGVAVYQLDPTSEELGRVEYREDLALYAQCRQTNTWPCYGDRIVPIQLDAWFLRRNEDKLGAA